MSVKKKKAKIAIWKYWWMCAPAPKNAYLVSIMQSLSKSLMWNASWLALKNRQDGGDYCIYNIKITFL